MIMLTVIGIGMVLAVLTVYMCRVVCLGRRCAYQGHTHITKHTRAATGVLIFLVLLLIAVEVFGRLLYSIDPPIQLLITHLSFSVPFLLVMLTLRFWVTGEKHVRLHRPIAYFSALLFLGTLITGTMLIVFELTRLEFV